MLLLIYSTMASLSTFSMTISSHVLLLFLHDLLTHLQQTLSKVLMMVFTLITCSHTIIRTQGIHGKTMKNPTTTLGLEFKIYKPAPISLSGPLVGPTLFAAPTTLTFDTDLLLSVYQCPTTLALSQHPLPLAL